MDEINACFISYRHTGIDSQKFIQAFVRELRQQLELWLPNAQVYFDENGLKVGAMYNEELAYELCRSACMVISYSRYVRNLSNHVVSRTMFRKLCWPQLATNKYNMLIL